jgi:tetratricopeptide (TPR) repeat protein
VAAAATALIPRAASAQKSPKAQEAYARAQDHLIAGRFADAATELETAVRYEPRFPMWWYILASTSRRAARCDRAVAAYRRYMELRPTEIDPYFGMALCLRTVGDRDDAIAAFRHYVDNDNRPSSREFVESARKHLADLERAPAPAPTAPSPAVLDARKLRDGGHADDAITRYRAAIASGDKSKDASAELGALLIAAKRNQDAVEPLRAAVAAAPAAADAWYKLAFALRETGQTAEAVDAYRRYITFKPKDPDPYYGLGRALVALGRDTEAWAAFHLYVSLEARPSEKRWLKKARAELARIEKAQDPGAAGSSAPPAMKSAPTTGSATGGQSGQDKQRAK